MIRGVLNLVCIALLTSALLRGFSPDSDAATAALLMPWLIFKTLLLAFATLAFTAILVCSLLGVAITERTERRAQVVCLTLAVPAFGGCIACMQLLARLIVA